MANSSDSLFVEMAVAKGYVDRAQADEAAKIQRAAELEGKGLRLLRDILVEKDWMSKEQASEVDSQIQDGSEKTGKIEGYKLLSKIGQGGMGTVYRAEREATGEIVALKILPGRMAKKEDFVERFVREARAAGRMTSKYIVRPVDVGFSGGYYYFAMEFVEGESVETTLSIDGAMAESRALRIIHQMALALSDAEEAGMVHRDIKPGNIIVTAEGVAKLTDFGLAREVTDDSVTQAGLTLGTPNYMSPEQAKAIKALDTRSDIYSLGVTFYHMVTGVVPFHGDTSLLTMLKHLNEPPVAPITRRPDLSRGCNDVILKMLTKDRDHRYRKAGQLVQDLELVLAGEPPKYAESTEPKPEEEAEEKAAGIPEEVRQFAEEIRKQGRIKWIRIGTGAFLLALVGIVAYAFWPGGTGGARRDGAVSNGPGKTLASARLERDARDALKSAQEFAARYPSRLVAIVEKFEAVEKQYRATGVYKEARKLHEQARSELDAAVRDAFEACRRAAEKLAKQDKFGAAQAEYDKFPAELRTRQAVERRIELAKLDLSERARRQFKELVHQAEVYIRNEKWGAAKATIAPALHFGIGGVRAEAKKMLSRIEYEALAANSEKSKAAIEAYQAAAAKIRVHVRSGKFDRALAELDQQRQRASHEFAREALRNSRYTIVTARKAWDAVMVAVAGLKPGFQVRVGTGVGRLVSYDAKRQRLRFRLGGRRVVNVSPGWLPPDTLKQLATADPGSNVTAVYLAAFFLARGDYPHAAAEIQNAKKAGSSELLIKRYEKQLTLLQKSREEIEAENLLAEAKEQAAAQGAPEQIARTLWELVSKYSSTRCYTGNSQEIEAMLAGAEAESITVDTLFTVSPTKLPDDIYELTYDFSDSGQAGDWSRPWKNRSVGRWPIRPVYGEMICESGLVYFKVPLLGDYQVLVKARDVRSASIRVAMPSPAASPGAGGVSFNWRREGEGMSSTLEKAGKPLGKPMKEPRFRVVGAVPFSVDVKGGTVTATVGDVVAHRADALTKAERDKPGYLVLDGFNPGARLTSITIRCKLDKDWLEKNFVEPLRKEKLREAKWRMVRYKPLLQGSDAGAWRLTSPQGAGHGEWTFATGYAIAPEDATCLMTTGDLNWRDYGFTAKIRIGTAPGAARIMTRWSDGSTAGAGRGYYINLTAGRGGARSGGKITLGKAVGGRQETLKQASVDLNGLDWYHVYVEVGGPRIRVLLGGREVLSAEDQTYAAGRVGLASHRSGAHFSNIRIKLMR